MLNILSGSRIDPGKMRPFVGNDGRSYITINSGKGYTTVPIQTNATLRRDEWKQLDEVVLEVSRQRLVGIQDLIANGLTFRLNNALGVTELEWHKGGDAMEAVITMDGVVRSQGDRVTFESEFLPIPVISSDFEIGLRALEASRKSPGADLELDSVRLATLAVTTQLEAMLFSDATYHYGRGTIYSYVNFPHRNLATLLSPWTAADPDDILADILDMKRASIDAFHYGPWMLYVPTAYETIFDRDYGPPQEGMTIRDRILKIDGIKDVKSAPMLAPDNVLLVQMNTDTVRLIDGLSPSPLQWTEEGNFINKFKIFAIQVPQIRADINDRCGIVHLA